MPTVTPAVGTLRFAHPTRHRAQEPPRISRVGNEIRCAGRSLRLDQPLEEQLRRHAPDFLDVAVDQRDRSGIEARQVGLIAADDRDVAGDGNVLLLDGAEHADEDPIARRDDGGRAIASLQQSEGGAVAEIGGQAERVDEVLGTDEAAAAKGFLETAHALAAGADVDAAGDERDAAMTEVDQMLGRLRHPERVVGEDGVHVERDLAVEEDRRHAQLLEALQRARRPARC